ncbi:MAG: hypothetical protein ACI906_002827 [Candidatus Latescibacterota bacterium]|jgi:hypothetical protein
MHLLRYAGLLLVFIMSTGHSPDPARAESDDQAKPRIIVEQVNPWSGLDLNNDPNNFQFAIVTDRTGGHRPGVFPDAIGKLNLLQPEFVMSVGDLIEGNTEDQAQLDMEWDEFNGFIDELEVPFFYLPGNHDITNEYMAKDWERRFGRAYYHFVYRDVLFLCLNTEGPPTSQISPEQVEYAARVLAENKDVRWTLVFQHKPLWAYDNAPGWADMEALLQGREHTVFAGHFHNYLKYERNDSKYFILATTGGGSGLRGPLFGQFDHVVWVTMTDSGPRIANLLLEGIWDEDVRTEKTSGLIDALLWGRAVTIKPLFAEQDDFKGGATVLRLINDADVPLEISARFVEQQGLRVEPTSFDIEVPPNSTEHIPLKVEAAEAMPVVKLTPAVLEWTASYSGGELGAMDFEGKTSLMVTQVYELAERKKRLEIDGDLSDWDHLPFVVKQPAGIVGNPESWTGPDDCSFSFGIEMDEEYVYIGVEVVDERPVYLKKAPWRQDGIEVRVDGRSDPVRSAAREGGPDMEEFLIIALSPDAGAGEGVTVAKELLDALGVKAVCIATPVGHQTEIAIPQAYFEQRQGEDWQALRLNIAVDDFDEEAGPLAQLWWMPSWRSAENFAGSGTFERK